MGGFGKMGRFRRSGRLVILLAGLLAFCGAAAAETAAVLRISPELPREGQPFSLSFLVPGAAAGDVRVGPGVTFPPSATLLGGPGIYPVSEKDPVTGNIERFVKVQYEFRAARAGRAVVEPIPFQVGESQFLTEGTVLEIAQRRGDLLVPFDLEWRVPASEVYEGQTVPAFLEMKNLPGIVVPESVVVAPPSGAVFEETEGLGTIGSVAAGGRELYRMTVAAYLLTPSSPGNVVLRTARVKAFGMTVESRALPVTVRRLPAEVRSTGAVGNFRVSSRVEPEEPRLGDTVRLFVRVEGEGNLNYLQLPPLQFPDFAVLGKTPRTRLSPRETGYGGSVEWEIRLSPQKTGDFRVTVPVFPWFDPAANEIRSSRERSHRVLVREAAEDAGSREGPKSRRVLRSDEKAASAPLDAYRRAYAYLLLLPGLGLLVHGLLRRRKRYAAVLIALLSASIFLLGSSEPSPDASLLLIEQGADAYERGGFADAVTFFIQAASALPENPGAHYNLGISYAALRDVPRAVFHLRRAVVIRPGSALFRETLADTENELGLTRQSAVPRLHPDYFFLFLVLTVNLAGCLPLAVKRRGPLFIAGILLSLLAVLSAAGLLYSAAERNARWGVVSKENAVLRKIPLPNSSEWLQLPAGTSVDVRGASGNFILTRTGFGVEGWMEADRMLLSPAGGSGGG